MRATTFFLSLRVWGRLRESETWMSEVLFYSSLPSQGLNIHRADRKLIGIAIFPCMFCKTGQSGPSGLNRTSIDVNRKRDQFVFSLGGLGPVCKSHVRTRTRLVKRSSSFLASQIDAFTVDKSPRLPNTHVCAGLCTSLRRSQGYYERLCAYVCAHMCVCMHSGVCWGFCHCERGWGKAWIPSVSQLAVSGLCTAQLFILSAQFTNKHG